MSMMLPNKREQLPHVLVSIDDLILIMFREGTGQIKIGDKIKMPCYDTISQKCLGKPTIQIYQGVKTGERKNEPYKMIWHYFCTSCMTNRYYGLFKKYEKKV